MLLNSDIIMSAMRSGLVYVNAVYMISLGCKCWSRASSVSKCFFLVYICLMGVIGAFVWYFAVMIEWSDCPVLWVVMWVIFGGQFEYMWSMHDIGFCFT